MNIQSVGLHKYENSTNKRLRKTERKNSQVSFGSDSKNEKYSFHFYPSSVNQVKLPGYIPDDVKINEVKMVNMARQKREYDWQYYIDNNYGNNNKIKFWRMLSSGIAPDNRQIPPPVSIEALNETIDKIDKLSEKECLEIYNSNLIKIF